MAKRLDELDNLVQESFQDGKDGEKVTVRENSEAAQSALTIMEETKESNLKPVIVAEHDLVIQDTAVEAEHDLVIQESSGSVKDAEATRDKETNGKKNTRGITVKVEKVLKEDETKSRRFPLLTKPSLYDDLEKIAYMNKLSVNEQINRYMEEGRKKDKDKIKKYNDFMA